MTAPVLALLAAGASSRMRGGDKLLERVGDRPLLRQQAIAALETAGIARVLVALPPAAEARRAALDRLPVEIVEVAEAAQGMGHSIAAIAARVPDGTPLVLLNADMPGIGTEELRRLVAAAAAAPDRVCRGMAADGTPGHPVAFPARLLADLRRLTGDTGAKALLAREGVVLVPLPGDAAVLDLDTPEDWAAWRTRQAGAV